jgi:hypothetical protein
MTYIKDKIFQIGENPQEVQLPADKSIKGVRSLLWKKVKKVPDTFYFLD